MKSNQARERNHWREIGARDFRNNIRRDHSCFTIASCDGFTRRVRVFWCRNKTFKTNLSKSKENWKWSRLQANFYPFGDKDSQSSSKLFSYVNFNSATRNERPSKGCSIFQNNVVQIVGYLPPKNSICFGGKKQPKNPILVNVVLIRLLYLQELKPELVLNERMTFQKIHRSLAEPDATYASWIGGLYENENSHQITLGRDRTRDLQAV